MKTDPSGLMVSRPLAILAGGGFFPVEVARHCQQNGYKPVFFALKGFADRSLAQEAETVWIDLLKPQHLLDVLKAFQPSGVVLAGHVKRPGAHVLVSAFSHLKQSTDLLGLLAQGDDHVLRGAIDALESEGLHIFGIDEVAPSLLCPAGTLGEVHPDDTYLRMMSIGFNVLRALSPYDCGQAAVIEGARILAVEGPEGTDQMIKRCKPRMNWFAKDRRVYTRLLVKAAKRDQDRRADLPAVGPRTIDACVQAGISGLALQAGSVILIEREEMIRRANAKGVFITGVKA
jgi:UDP-2,3-diacylglucosamine hydrolase